MNPGWFVAIAAAVFGAISARILSSQGRGTPASRALMLIGLALWIVAAYLLPPVALLERLSLTPWVLIPIRVIAAYLLGSTVSKIWYAIVP